MEEDLILKESYNDTNNYIENLGGLKNEENTYFIDDIIDVYLKKIEKISLLTPEEERDLFINFSNGDTLARNRLIEANLYLVIRIVRMIMNRGHSFMDLIEEGNIALINAVKTFDIKTGLKFSTYAFSLIYSHLCNLLKKHQETISIDALLNEENELFTDDNLLEDYVITKVDFLTAENMFYMLNEKEIFVLINHFGLNGVKIKSLEEIGNYLNIKRETVRQNEIRALKKLRTGFQRKKLDAIKVNKIFFRKEKKKKKTIVRRFVYKGQNNE